MDHTNFHRLRRDMKALAAAVGIGGMITMGVVSVAHPTTSVGTNSDNWTAEHNLTLVPEIRAQPPFEPKVIVDRCALATIHMRMHHNC
jgi:hypothetical protein